MSEFDSTKDYYSTLGVAYNCTIEELKNAHITLALKYHPDMQKEGADNSEAVNRFRNISEAWQVLSKPEIRKKYDISRGINTLDKSSIGLSSSNLQEGEIDGAFNVQKANYANVKYQASSNWRDLQSKYKTEKWHNMPLENKKALRRGNITSAGESAFKFVIPFCVVCAGAYYVYLYSQERRSSRYNSINKK